MPLDPADLPPLPNRDELPRHIRAAENNAQKLRIRAAEKIKAAHQAAEKARRALYAYAAIARGNRTALAVSTVQSACDELATAADTYTLSATYPCAEVTESYLRRKAPKLHPQGHDAGEDETAPSQPPPDLSDPLLSALTAGNPAQATNPATRILVRVIRGQAAAQAASALAASGKPVPPELIELIESTVADLTSVLRLPSSPAVQINTAEGPTAGTIDAEFEDVP